MGFLPLYQVFNLQPKEHKLEILRHGFSAEDHVHWGEDPSLPTPCEMPSSLEQHLMNVYDTFRSDSKQSQKAHHHMIPPVGDLPHLQTLPPLPSRWFRQITLLHHLESHFLRNLGDLIIVPEPRQRIPTLNPLYNLDVLGVICLVSVSSDPLIGDVERAGAEHPVNLGVDVLEFGRMAGGLDRVGTVEGGIRERHLEEIATDNLAEIVYPGFLVVGTSTVDLLDAIKGVKRGIKEKKKIDLLEKTQTPEIKSKTR